MKKVLNRATALRARIVCVAMGLVGIVLAIVLGGVFAYAAPPVLDRPGQSPAHPSPPHPTISSPQHIVPPLPWPPPSWSYHEVIQQRDLWSKPPADLGAGLETLKARIGRCDDISLYRIGGDGFAIAIRAPSDGARSSGQPAQGQHNTLRSMIVSVTGRSLDKPLPDSDYSETRRTHRPDQLPREIAAVKWSKKLQIHVFYYGYNVAHDGRHWTRIQPDTLDKRSLRELIFSSAPGHSQQQ